MNRTCLLLCVLLAVAILLGSAATPQADEPADEQLVRLVLELLADKDKDVRALGLEQVRRQAKGEAATRLFAAQLSKLGTDAQAGLLGALGDRGDAAARPAVLQALAQSDDEAVRVAAIGALGSLGGTDDLPQLVDLLFSPSQAEQASARDSLTRMHGEGVHRAIGAAMDGAPGALRVALIEILVTRRAVDTAPQLLEAAKDDDPQVRMAAMAALGQLANNEHIPGMVRGVLRAEPGAERAAAEKAVMFVCGRIEDSERRAVPLLAFLDESDAGERIVLLPMLGRVGGALALPVIETAIAEPDEKAHEEGVIAICNWPDASVASRLIVLARTDEHLHCRARALRALIRVAPLADGRSDDERLALLVQAMGMCERDADRNLVLERARAIRTIDALRFVTAFMDEPGLAQKACETVVELAHHRGLREPNKAEFDRALDKVIETSEDALIVERAQRYKKGQTWARPTAEP